MTNCTNPDCLCHEVAPKPFSYLSKRDEAKKYGSLRSKLRNARDEMIQLNEGGFGKLSLAIRDLERALERVETEEAKRSAKVGFTIDHGVGPGDWKNT